MVTSLNNNEIDFLLKNKLKLKSDLFNVKQKKKKLVISQDANIHDLSQIAKNYATNIINTRDNEIKKWIELSTRPCVYSIIFIHPDTKKKFLEVNLHCLFQIIEDNVKVVYNSHIKTTESEDPELNGKKISLGSNFTKLLYYLSCKNMVLGTLSKIEGYYVFRR